MPQSASTSRPIASDPLPGISGSSSRVAQVVGAKRAPGDDEPTVISSEPPLSAPHIADSDRQLGHGGLLPGDRLEHFELLEYIGGGGMGRVFRARDTRLDRVVALKVLAPTQTTDADALARFQNEAQSAARLDHENIARVYHVGEDRGLHYIVFEYVEGVNLRALVHENGPLPLADAINYTLQVAEALAHAASRDVVHRDIKPSNVLVMPSGRAKLIDMGLARLHKIDPVAADLTASGVTLGTFDYISPEQARDPRNADVRSDIYSLGCTLFFMLAGRPPFPEGTVLQKLLQHQGDEPPSVRQFRPDTPDELRVLLRRMMAKDPRDRYATAPELLDDLTTLARHLGLRPLTGGSRVWELPQPPRISRLAYHLPWLAPTAALLCVVAALHFFGGRDAPPPPVLGGPEELIGELPDPADFPSAAPADISPLSSAIGSDGATDARINPPSVAAAETPRSEPPDLALGGTTSAGAPTPSIPQDPKTPGASEERVEDQPTTGMASRDLAGELAMESAAAGLTVGQSPDAMVRLPSALADSGGIRLGTPELASAAPARTDALQPAGVLIVNSGESEEPGYPSLTAALAVAETGNVIELRYNGQREQTPLKLAGRRLTIRGAEGFQPVILFRPNGSDPVEQPRSMITVTSGELALVNLAVEFDVSRKTPAETWSLIEVFGGAQIDLQRSTFSIYNASDDGTAYHPNVAFFRTRPAPGADRITTTAAEAAAPIVTVELVDCCVRGQAAVLRSEAFQSVAFSWENGFLATSEPFVSLAAGARAPAETDAATINLRHLTAMLGGGLLAMTDRQPAARQMPTSISLSDSILIGAPGVPLLDQYGETGDDPRTKVHFQGNRNFYEGFDLFWRVQGSNKSRPPVLVDYSQWQSHWGAEDEYLPSFDRVEWQKDPQPELAPHRARISDIALDPDALENPVRGAASNGRDAGCDPAQLSEFPAP